MFVGQCLSCRPRLSSCTKQMTLNADLDLTSQKFNSDTWHVTSSIRRSVSRESLIGLVVSLVLTRLDYCNAVLAGLPAYQLDRLQSATNAADRTIYRARYDHVSSLLKELHWLRVSNRIEFKLCALVYKCLNGNGPAYLDDSLQRVTDVQSRRRLCGHLRRQR